MKTKTLKLLQITQHEYETKLMQLWLKWCTTKVHNPKNLQKMLVCQALFNWWQGELQNLETEFVKDMNDFGYACPVTCMKAYDFTIEKIFNRFSKPLIKHAQTNHTITDQN